jgi:hypothetical protein
MVSAFRRQGDSLAGQPLRGAVGAELDERVHAFAFAQGEMEGHVTVAGRQGAVVIGDLSVEPKRAGRLEGDH